MSKINTYSRYDVRGSELIDLACMDDADERWKLVDKITQRRPQLSLHPRNNPMVASLIVVTTVLVIGSIIGHAMEAWL